MLTPRVLAAIPIVPVTSLSKSMEWYERLGFVPRSDEDRTAKEYALLTFGAVELHLRPLCTTESIQKDHNPVGVYIRVEGIDQLYENLKQKGGLEFDHGPQDQPWEMREFLMSDPDGNSLRFGQVPGV